MSLINAFCDEIKLGMLVTLWFGVHPPVSGTVISLTDEIVRLRCETGSPRISLDSIIAYDTSDFDSDVDTSDSGSAVCTQDAVAEAPAAEAPVYTPSPELVKLLAVFEDCIVPTDEECADFEGACADLRDCDDMSLRSAAEGVSSSFIGLRRQNTDGFDMHNIRARTLKLALDYPDYSALLYCLLGSMYYTVGDFENAHYYFSRGGDLLGAVYSAIHTGDEKALSDALEDYIALPELPELFALKLFAEHAVKTMRIGALEYHIDSIRYAGDELDDEADLLISCCALITSLAGLSEDWLDARKNSKLAALDAFIAGLPEDWSKDRSGISLDCDFDEYHVDPAREVGEIVKYSDQKHCGFIGEGADDCFFYMGQIPEDEPLRELLKTGYWQKLEVSYLEGINHTNHSRAAYDIRLTPRMQSEVEKRKEELKALDVTLTGYIESDEFNCRSGFGRIICGDKHYSVRRAEIVDPYLWASMCGNIKFSLKVVFRPIRLRDRYGAADVRSAEPIELSEYDLNRAITSGEITRAAVDCWADRRAKLDAPEEYVDERRIKYIPLTPWSERDKLMSSFTKKAPSNAPKTAPGRIFPPKDADPKPETSETVPASETEPVIESATVPEVAAIESVTTAEPVTEALDGASDGK